MKNVIEKHWRLAMEEIYDIVRRRRLRSRDRRGISRISRYPRITATMLTLIASREAYDDIRRKARVFRQLWRRDRVTNIPGHCCGARYPDMSCPNMRSWINQWKLWLNYETDVSKANTSQQISKNPDIVQRIAVEWFFINYGIPSWRFNICGYSREKWFVVRINDNFVSINKGDNCISRFCPIRCDVQ